MLGSTDALLRRLFLISAIGTDAALCARANAEEPPPARNVPVPKPKANDLDEHIAKLSEEIRRDPESVKAFFQRALYWDEKQEFVKALKDYAEVIRLSPRFTFAFIHRGELWREMGESDRAQADFDEALRLYDGAVRRDPKSVHTRIDRAWVWYAKGEIRNAIADLEQAIALQSVSSFHVMRGIAWKDLGELDKAVSDCDRAIELDRANAAAWACRGVVRALGGERNNAIADFTEAIRLGPAQPSTYTHRANVFLKMGELDKAIEDCTEAVRLCSRFAPAFRCRAHSWLAKNDLNRALADFDHAIRFTPNYVKVTFNSREFSPHRRAADRIYSNDDSVQLDRAIVWQMTGAWDKAIADLGQAIRLDPKSALAHDSHAWLRATCPDDKSRDGKMAVELATKACELTEWKSDAFIATLAAAHAEAGQFDEAKKRLQQAIDLAPKKDVETRAQMMKLFNDGKPYHEEPKAK
jgi:tetratricopeptide (TPR) repeat protein